MWPEELIMEQKPRSKENCWKYRAGVVAGPGIFALDNTQRKKSTEQSCSLRNRLRSRRGNRLCGGVVSPESCLYAGGTRKWPAMTTPGRSVSGLECPRGPLPPRRDLTPLKGCCGNITAHRASKPRTAAEKRLPWHWMEYPGSQRSGPGSPSPPGHPFLQQRACMSSVDTSWKRELQHPSC